MQMTRARERERKNENNESGSCEWSTYKRYYILPVVTEETQAKKEKNANEKGEQVLSRLLYFMGKNWMMHSFMLFCCSHTQNNIRRCRRGYFPLFARFLCRSRAQHTRERPANMGVECRVFGDLSCLWRKSMLQQHTEPKCQWMRNCLKQIASVCPLLIKWRAAHSLGFSCPAFGSSN